MNRNEALKWLVRRWSYWPYGHEPFNGVPVGWRWSGLMLVPTGQGVRAIEHDDWVEARRAEMERAADLLFDVVSSESGVSKSMLLGYGDHTLVTVKDRPGHHRLIRTYPSWGGKEISIVELDGVETAVSSSIITKVSPAERQAREIMLEWGHDEESCGGENLVFVTVVQMLEEGYSK